LITNPKVIKFSDAVIDKLNLNDDDFAYLDHSTQSIKYKKQI